ncbi:uncharacterized protein LOC121872625 [Homarus americanus]|uniref:uncharacterized protein LOC121872625 n=1 Tax=Homarus americanus TaxID=6706 RepID=UPI001C43C042|nr:uncharacterized protein LOC121872625 [Homarus americanus]XP_042231463.1 uncharacterized protein LOC121872625 [Homarus americanus]XP_042231464.1 uncharacterized protein LOC121872625 [Homarus americanus]XP_042231465.1 uncharacterized protein LOC121872625 [Homarus americanus]XP_042231466.1 uncharacterized protein LOC121872625 [Homarus americanus]XP_042231468.1 uncharacterized protein LOC121872625 [Homarus americanus]XP_042231469.1 uncharacterized protein LOC121872625 [Homarus americanus]XP_0
MPVVNPAESLLKLSLQAVCSNVKVMVTRAADFTESADAVLQVAEEQVHKLLLSQTQNRYGQDTYDNVEKRGSSASIKFKNIQDLFKKHNNSTEIISKYLENLPAAFLNEVFKRTLILVAGIIVYDEEQIENYMADKWSFVPRVKVAFHFLMKSMLFPSVSSLDISPITTAFFQVFAQYLMKHDTVKEDILVKLLNNKEKDIFLSTIITYKKRLTNLTSLSFQNLAHGELVWLISCQCPNLWHLDLSGGLFDLQRYCVTEMSGGQHVTAVNTNGTRNYQEADFVGAICGLYGNHGFQHTIYDGIAQGCLNLKTLLLPECKWEKHEEDALLDGIKELLLHAPYIEEITGICLIYILCKLNELEYPPILLKLKKFNGKTGGHNLVGVAPRRLKKVQLPFVTEVIMSLNVFMPSVTLEIFPNMRHLTVTPYDYRSYNFDDILPYLTNLHTLNMELTHEVSISNICDIAENCKLIESLTLTCPALRMQAVDINEDLIAIEEPERNSPSPLLIKNIPGKKMNEPQESLHILRSFPEYQALLKIDPAPYEKDNSQIPNFLRLHTLQFFGIRSVEAAALYKCIKEPIVQTLTFVAQEIGDDCRIELNDDFVGRIAPLLKKLRNLKIFAEDDQKHIIPIANLTSLGIEHILRFCFDIRSIGNMASWNLTADGVKILNNIFKKDNYIFKVY